MPDIRLGTKEPPVSSEGRHLISGIGASLAVFAADLATPLGIAWGVMHVLAVIVTLGSPRVRDTLWVAALASGLVLAAIALAPAAASTPVIWTNRALSLVAIWAAAWLAIAHARTRQRVSQAEQRAERLLAQVLDAAPDGMLVVDRSGLILHANIAAGRIFDYPPERLVGAPLDTLVPEESRSAHPQHRRAFFEAPAPRPMGAGRPYPALRRDGSTLCCEIALSPLAENGSAMVIAAVRDVSERMRFEQRLRETQKMEAIGRLAGGVAHDFNNILTAIMSYADLVRVELAQQPEVRADVDEILTASRKAASLTQQLLAFSRRQIIEPRPMVVNDLVLGMDKMLRRILGEDIELVTLPAPDLWAVEVDPGQLEQVILNLAVNARDAMPRGGKITLETTNVTLDAEYAGDHPEVAPGDYVRLAVSDTGCGMTEEVRARIFEPFFTTKDAGEGTGLGLATCYGIVRQARGHIWVYSEPGRGTTFKVYLPRSYAVPAPPPAERAEGRKPGGHELVLLVEDEPSVRTLAARALGRAGYRVVEAGNGVEALQKVGSLERPLDLLVTDVVMPQMGGKELAARLTERQPGLRILYVSGYTENAIVHHGVLDKGIVFLQKPFMPDALLERVRQILDA